MLFRGFFLLSLLLSSGSLYAADVVATEVAALSDAGQFFTCIVAGIILAFAFQYLLTNLAVALGITAAGDVRDYEPDWSFRSPGRSYTSATKASSNQSDSDDNVGDVGVKVFTGLGIFMTVSTAISLFFASWLAVKLSILPSNSIGITLGLVIWAGFVLIASIIDAKFLSSVTGGLISLVKGGFSASGSALSGVFGKSDKKKARVLAQEAASAIHDELKQEFDFSRFEKKLDEYVDKLQPPALEPKKLRKELEKLIHEIEVEEVYTPDDPDATKKLILEVANKKDALSAKDKEKISSMVDDIKASARESDSRMGAAQKAFDKLSPGDEAEGQRYRQQIEAYLSKTGREELDPETLKRDLEAILDDPKTAQHVAVNRLKQLDRGSIKALLASHEKMDEAKAEKVIGAVESTVQKILNKKQQMTSSSRDTGSDFSSQRGAAERRVEEWFNRTNRPELRYNVLKADFEKILDDPKTAPHVLRNRINRMDKKTIIALLSNNSRISERQAEEMTDSIESAKENVLLKIDQMEAELETRLKQAQHYAFKEAEALRRTAMAAAWWLLISMLVAGVAAAAGGALAVGESLWSLF